MADDDALRLEALARVRIIADPRKFRDYVLVPNYPGGKSHIFLETLGFRPHSVVDAWALARLYEEQARQQIVACDVKFAGAVEFGERYTITIDVRGVALRTGWLLANDVLRLATPFSGFAHEFRKG